MTDEDGKLTKGEHPRKTWKKWAESEFYVLILCALIAYPVYRMVEGFYYGVIDEQAGHHWRQTFDHEIDPETNLPGGPPINLKVFIPFLLVTYIGVNLALEIGRRHFEKEELAEKRAKKRGAKKRANAGRRQRT